MDILPLFLKLMSFVDSSNPFGTSVCSPTVVKTKLPKTARAIGSKDDFDFVSSIRLSQSDTVLSAIHLSVFRLRILRAG